MLVQQGLQVLRTAQAQACLVRLRLLRLCLPSLLLGCCRLGQLAALQWCRRQGRRCATLLRRPAATLRVPAAMSAC